jgi:hypothetical protein
MRNQRSVSLAEEPITTPYYGGSVKMLTQKIHNRWSTNPQRRFKQHEKEASPEPTAATSAPMGES